MPLNIEKSVSVTDALNSRITVRDFLATPVPQDVLQNLFETAQRSPSGGNLQPWHVHVMTGRAMAVDYPPMASAAPFQTNFEGHPAGLA